MTRTPIRIAGAFALTTALALATAACAGGGDKKAACDKLQSTIQDVSQKGMTQINDPNGLAQTYTDAAATMRQEGKDAGDDGVEQAANHAASALESLGQQVRSISSGNPPQVDTSSLISAGTELKTACEG